MLGNLAESLTGLVGIYNWFTSLFDQNSSTAVDPVEEAESAFTDNAAATDSDGDGLSDDTEIVLGTDANNADTDGDGGFDGDEFAAGTDPLSASSYTSSSETEVELDLSYQVRQFEMRHGINNGKYDLPDGEHSDADGVPDHVEIEQGTDPEASDDYLDTDRDGISDYYETEVLGTDKDKIDTDGDGDWDLTELDNGTDPTDAEDFTDSNFDRVSDGLAERLSEIASKFAEKYNEIKDQYENSSQSEISRLEMLDYPEYIQEDEELTVDLIGISRDKGSSAEDDATEDDEFVDVLGLF